MLEDQIRKETIEAMRNRDDLKKGILRVVLGEIDAELGRGKNPSVNDDKIIQIIRKIVVSNKETIDAGASNSADLIRENEVLSEFLPQTMSAEAIEAFLLPISEQIINASTEGAATGIAMKALKSAEKVVLGGEVKQLVVKMRQ